MYTSIWKLPWLAANEYVSVRGKSILVSSFTGSSLVWLSHHPPTYLPLFLPKKKAKRYRLIFGACRLSSDFSPENYTLWQGYSSPLTKLVFTSRKLSSTYSREAQMTLDVQSKFFGKIYSCLHLVLTFQFQRSTDSLFFVHLRRDQRIWSTFIAAKSKIFTIFVPTTVQQMFQASCSSTIWRSAIIKFSIASIIKELWSRFLDTAQHILLLCYQQKVVILIPWNAAQQILLPLQPSRICANCRWSCIPNFLQRFHCCWGWSSWSSWGWSSWSCIPKGECQNLCCGIPPSVCKGGRGDTPQIRNFWYQN